MRGWLANILHLGRKELYSLRADPVLVGLILYCFTLAVYSVANGAKFEVEHAAVGVVDEDRSTLSLRLRAAIREPLFTEPVEIRADEIDAAMDRGRFALLVEIPAGLEADLLAGRPGTVRLDVDATAMTVAGNGSSYLQTILTREAAAFLRRGDGTGTAPIDLVVHRLFNPNGQSTWFTSVMQVINNITVLSVILSGAALIREREQGTVEHLLVMPVTPVQLMLAKLWANGLVIIAAALLSLIGVVHLLLGVPLVGSLALFALGALVYQLSVSALGILLATLTGNMPQFGLLAMPVLIIMDLLSGATTPLESMPGWLQSAIQVSPATHFVAFAQGVLYRGAGLETLWPQLLKMAVMGAAFVALSLARFRRSIIVAS
jgi:ABC-2 type transport system permease protein